ncbi:DUF6844 domain-containing protein [Helicobacter sp. MIT 05-5294]|uniref:DUF6844 domain-containing protein n=1 Tax=Helicobacter sp. MIT 05-5294 TaxID=1548150 RepID=UPI0010FE35E9|nr:hypothetical protein [Helicobacter sp. MIT 05-5294]TLD89163.1 hypothetical protein LS69_000565 [Helicobacter sp. MIT 05-5294]
MKKLTAIIGSIVLSTMLFAQNTKQELEDLSKPIIDQNVDKPKKADIYELISKAQKELRKRQPNAKVYQAVVSVDVGPDDVQYYEYLASAYNQAVLDIKAQMVLRKTGEIQVEESYKLYQKQIPDDLLKAELRKEVDEKIKEAESQENDLFALVGKIIDKAVSNGKNEEEKKKIEAEVEQTLFNKAMMEKAIKSGFDEISGLVPYENFIVTKNDGEVELGVLAYVTERSVALARDLRQGHQSKKTTNTAQCKSAESIVDTLDDNALNSKLGLQYYYNENCRPALLAYGLDSFMKEEGMNADNRRISIEHARSMADKIISNFLSSNVNVESITSKLSEKVRTASINAVKDAKKTTYKNNKTNRTSMIKEISQEFTSSSSMSLRGLEDARIWSIDKGDYMLVGTIRYYSMDSIEAANREFDPNYGKDYSAKETQKSYGNSVKRSSNIEVDDF